MVTQDLIYLENILGVVDFIIYVLILLIIFSNFNIVL